jgi:hypothetical protein
MHADQLNPASSAWPKPDSVYHHAHAWKQIENTMDC